MRILSTGPPHYDSNYRFESTTSPFLVGVRVQIVVVGSITKKRQRLVLRKARSAESDILCGITVLIDPDSLAVPFTTGITVVNVYGMARGKKSSSKKANATLKVSAPDQQHGENNLTSGGASSPSRSGDIREVFEEIGLIKLFDPHIFDFDEAIFAMCPASKGWLVDYAKSEDVTAADVLIAMMKIQGTQADAFKLIMAMGMKDAEDREHIQSLGVKVRDDIRILRETLNASDVPRSPENMKSINNAKGSNDGEVNSSRASTGKYGGTDICQGRRVVNPDMKPSSSNESRATCARSDTIPDYDASTPALVTGISTSEPAKFEVAKGKCPETEESDDQNLKNNEQISTSIPKPLVANVLTKSKKKRGKKKKKRKALVLKNDNTDSRALPADSASVPGSLTDVCSTGRAACMVNVGIDKTVKTEIDSSSVQPPKAVESVRVYSSIALRATCFLEVAAAIGEDQVGSMTEEHAEKNNETTSTREDVQSTSGDDADVVPALPPNDCKSDLCRSAECIERASNAAMIHRATRLADDINSLRVRIDRLSSRVAPSPSDRHEGVRYITIADMDVKALFDMENSELSVAYTEFPCDIDYLDVVFPKSVPQIVRQCWFENIFWTELAAEAEEEFIRLYTMLDCALHIWTSSMNASQWETRKTHERHLERLPIVQLYGEARLILLQSIDNAHLANQVVIQNLNEKQKQRVWPDALAKLLSVGRNLQDVDTYWSYRKERLDIFPVPSNLEERLEMYRLGVCRCDLLIKGVELALQRKA